MKKSIKFTLLAFGLFLVCVAAVSPAMKPIAPYEREQMKGNVRVVLLKIEHATIFSTAGISNPQPGKSYPVPVIGVTYLVEALGNELITNWNTYATGEEISIGGRKISGDATFIPENLISGSTRTTSPISAVNNSMELPKSIDKKRSSVEEIYVRTASSQTGAVRLQLQAGFNGHTETFIFENIPLN
jgi:hypothetical protein